MPHVKLSTNEARWRFAPVAANGYYMQQIRRTGDYCNIHRLRSVCGYSQDSFRPNCDETVQFAALEQAKLESNCA